MLKHNASGDITQNTQENASTIVVAMYGVYEHCAAVVVVVAWDSTLAPARAELHQTWLLVIE